MLSVVGPFSLEGSALSKSGLVGVEALQPQTLSIKSSVFAITLPLSHSGSRSYPSDCPKIPTLRPGLTQAQINSLKSKPGPSLSSL